MNWQEVKAEFEFDGSLRDIYILGTDLETWQMALSLLRSGPYPLNYIVNSEKAELPGDVITIFARREEANLLLSLNVSGIEINCHFFTQEEIEFDIDPRQVTDETNFGHLCKFIRWIGHGLNRDVILTPEGGELKVITRYVPEHDDLEYTPVGIPC